MLEALADKNDEEYEDLVDWLTHHAKNYHPYDPDLFEATKVKFDNPKKRWKKSFG